MRGGSACWGLRDASTVVRPGHRLGDRATEAVVQRRRSGLEQDDEDENEQ